MGFGRSGLTCVRAFRTSAIISSQEGSTWSLAGTNNASGSPPRNTRNRWPCLTRSNKVPVCSCSSLDVMDVMFTNRHQNGVTVNPFYLGQFLNKGPLFKRARLHPHFVLSPAIIATPGPWNLAAFDHPLDMLPKMTNSNSRGHRSIKRNPRSCAFHL